ncbi:hypothetical protein KFU94_64310 [Chloroflexi bacterium TSY]|nr:hypothetical protein [Chloroflexi bacterium TSY]
MNWFFIIAGALTLLALPFHVWGGEYTLRRTPTEAFPNIPNGDSSIAKQEIRFGWHIGSIDFLVSGSVLLITGLTNWVEPAHIVGRLIATYFFGYSFVIAIVPALSLRRLEPLRRCPQWVLALSIALLAWLGGG